VIATLGTTKLHRLEENLDAADAGLTVAGLSEIERDPDRTLKLNMKDGRIYKNTLAA
jgi:hypothetical protein